MERPNRYKRDWLVYSREPAAVRGVPKRSGRDGTQVQGDYIMFERTDYNGTALQMLWNAYYHILTSRTGVERDTLSILRLHANSEAISIMYRGRVATQMWRRR